MVMAALDDINGDCETAPMCSARHLNLNEFLDPIKHGPEKSITTTEKHPALHGEEHEPIPSRNFYQTHCDLCLAWKPLNGYMPRGEILAQRKRIE